MRMPPFPCHMCVRLFSDSTSNPVVALLKILSIYRDNVEVKCVLTCFEVLTLKSFLFLLLNKFWNFVQHRYVITPAVVDQWCAAIL